MRDKQGLRVNGVAPPDEPLESFKPSRSLKEIGSVFHVNFRARWLSRVFTNNP